MLKLACRDHKILPEEAWLIGDAVTDIAAAVDCGIPSTFVLSGRGLGEFHRSPDLINCTVATSLASAVWKVIAATSQTSRADILRADVVRRD